MVEYLPHMHKNDLGFILQDYKKKKVRKEERKRVEREGRRDVERAEGRETE